MATELIARSGADLRRQIEKPDRRQRVNLSLRVSTVQQARALGLNLSRIVDETLAEAVRAEKARRWEQENKAAIEHHAQRIERKGMWNKDLVSF